MLIVTRPSAATRGEINESFGVGVRAGGCASTATAMADAAHAAAILQSTFARRRIVVAPRVLSAS
jgi:hypothetical protein